MPRHAASRSSRRLAVPIIVALAFLLIAGGGTAIGVAWNQRSTPLSEPSAADRTSQAPAAERETIPDDGADTVVEPPSVPEPEPEPEPQPDAVFTIVAGGDVLTHGPVNSSARTSSGYDYTPLLAGITPWVEGADLALCHLEVPIAPSGTAPTGYPMFGAPHQIVADLARQGWDGCSTASNHSVDRGWDGVLATAAEMDEHNLGYVGTSVNAKQQRQPQRYVLSREGQDITVAHIAATYGTNGLPVPSGRPWSVNLIDTDALIKQAKKARKNGADLVIASLHFGQEYRIEPTTDQREVASALADSGQVDLIIGHHAHISQPMEKIPGGPQDAGMWVAFGLGNMISNQDASCCVVGTESGLLMIATVTKAPDGPAQVSSMQWQGITVDRRDGHRVFPFASNLKKGAGTLSSSELSTRRDRVRDAVGSQATERRKPPVPTGPIPEVLPRTNTQP